MKLSKLLKQLEEKGFKVKYQDILDGEVIGLDLYNNCKKHIRLDTQYNEEYVEELRKLPKGTEYIIDYSRMECIGAFFECCIDYPEGAERCLDRVSNGIHLHENNAGYCKMDYFWEAFNAFNNLTNHALTVMNSHIEHINYFNDIISPILHKYDFINTYDTFFDSNEKTYIGSTPTFIYKYAYDSNEDLYFWTDPISLEFKGTIDPYSPNFEEKLKEWMHYESGIVKSCFERFFTDDETYTPTSHRDILAVWSSIEAMRKKEHYYFYPPESINFDNIPESQKGIIEEYYKLYNNEKV